MWDNPSQLLKHGKRKVVKKYSRALAATVLLGGMGAAIADGPPKPEDYVEYRQGVMTAIGWNFGTMAAMVKKDMPWDTEDFAERAKRVAALSSMPLEGFTPETRDLDTHAKPEIWDNWDDFKSQMEKLEQETAKLAEVAATGDMAKIGPQFGEVGQTCKGCHDDYEQD